MTRVLSFPSSAWERTSAKLCFACLLVAAVARGTISLAADPSINNLAPAGVQRGTQAEFTITGGNLGNVQEILFYTPGFEVKKLTPAEGTLKALVAVAADCELGLHAIRLRSTTGVSNLRTFSVGNLPEIKEVEPNTLFTQPQAITPSVTISGTIQNEDVDHFVVELKKGDRLTAELEGLRLGNTFFDPYLAILNADRFELTRSDDAALLNQDCLASIVAQEDGKYIVQVRESSFGAGSAYRLHIGNFPRPTAAFPPGGRPGETLTVRWLGDAAGAFDQQITLPPANLQGQAAVIARDGRGEAPSPNVLRVIDLPGYIEAEPNNEVKTPSSSGAAPLAFSGIIEKEDDVDFFKFMAKKGQQFDVRVYARKPLRSPLDSVLTVHNAQGGGIGNNDDTGGPDSYFRLNVPADGDYLVSVRDQLKAGGPDYIYRVEITEAKPSLVMRLPERRQYVSTTLVVPKNNRMAVMVAAQRQNFGGDLSVIFEGLPPGMTADPLPLTANRSEIPVIFTAAADAQPAGALVGIVGKTVDEKLGVVGRLNQRTMLVRGQNNVDVWGHDADRMAAVLSEEIPFSIDIVPPRAPLVRNGAMDLKVVAKRAPGFTGAISLRMLYNPPGVASSGNVSIPENQNEGIVPLTANGGAAIGTWKIVVTGRSGSRGQRGGGGGNRTGTDDSFTCSSGFADLAVSDQYYKLAFNKTAAEQGQEAEVAVKVEKLKDFEGTAKAELVGLPANTTAQPVEFTKDTSELVFKVNVTKEAKPGRYPSLVCVTKFAIDGETVTHTLGTGELRVDAPLPPKPNAAAAKAGQPAAAAKRLSRLEQLRLEKEQEEKK
jgi:hypothetical protein